MFNYDIRTSLFSGKTGIPAKTRTPSHNTGTLLKPVPYGRGYMDRAGPGTGTLGKPVPDPCHALTVRTEKPSIQHDPVLTPAHEPK